VSKKVTEKLVSLNRLRSSLKVERIRRSEHFYFNLLEFRFFRDTEGGVTLPFGNNRPVTNLVMMPYVLFAELFLFRAARFFVRLGKYMVGVLVLREREGNLYIASLAVAQEYRRLGVATFVLMYAERLASALHLEGVQLTVLKRNLPAQRLYLKLGFKPRRETRSSFVLQKKINVK
jgi:ribosomal protein S18 acetylase RimI-like enzyme